MTSLTEAALVGFAAMERHLVSTTVTRLRLVGGAIVAAAVLAMAPQPANGVVVGTVTTFPVVANLSMDVTVTVHWQGIKAGCFAPQENFDIVHTFSYDTHPNGKKSTVKPGIATLTSGLGRRFFGATPTLGAPRGARQSGSASNWVLEVGYPAGCGSDPPPPPPPTIVTPQCKSVAERVSVSLEAASASAATHGGMTIRRTPSKNPTAPAGANIGASCFRTLHDIDFATKNSQLAIFDDMTFMQVPVPRLRQRLELLADGKSSAPLVFSISGDCNAAVARPSIGPVPNFVAHVGQPHDAIGQGGHDPGNSTCTVAGSGRLKLTRAGAVKEVTLRP